MHNPAPPSVLAKQILETGVPATHIPAGDPISGLFSDQSRTMDLLAALEIIRNAPDESLCIYAVQTITALKEIGKRLQYDLLPCSPIVVDTPSFVESTPPRTPDTSPSPNDLYYAKKLTPAVQSESPVHKTPDRSQRETRTPGEQSASTVTGNKTVHKTVDSLLKGIEKHASWLIEARTLDEDVIVSRKRGLEDDIRWEDISHVEGIKAKDPESKVRRVLALRSLAQEHDEKQAQNGISPTRLEELRNYVSCPGTSTLNLKANHTVKEPFKTRALHCGLRHLIIENALNTHLEAHKLPGNCEAISVALALNMHNFRCLRYDDFQTVVNAIQTMQIPINKKQAMPPKTQSLLSLLRDSNEWFKRLQHKYNRVY